MRIHHLAVVVRSLRKSAVVYRRLGMVSTPRFRVGERYPGKSKHEYWGQAFYDSTQGFPVFWLMQPIGKQGPLAKHGPGFHHVGLMGRDIQRVRLPFRRRPHHFVEENVLRGFLDRKATDGLRIELEERKFTQPQGSLHRFCARLPDHVGIQVRSLDSYDRFFRFLGFEPDPPEEDRAFRIARYRIRGFHVALFEPKQGEPREGVDHVALPLEGLSASQVVRALRKAKIPYRGPYELPGETSIKLADPGGLEWELLVR